MATWCGFAPGRHGSVFIALDKWDKLSPSEVRQELEHAGHPPTAVARMMELYDQPDPARGLDALRRQLGNPEADGAVATLSRILDTVRAAAGARFDIDFDATLVRGMGYYTGPIFELGSSDFSAGSIAGGGRYDGMIGRLLGRDVPATGFSIGFERVVEILSSRSNVGGRAEPRMVAAAQTLRAQGHLVSLERRARSQGTQRAALERQGYDGVATVGPEGRPDIQWFAERVRPGETRSRE
jgi:histidyl-tRNA synthetase